MARWASELSAEDAEHMSLLFRQLLRMKPRGWAVGRGHREIVIRPPERSLGKFGITLHRPDEGTPKLCAAFFSRCRNIWSERAYFAVGSEAAGVVTWMQEVVASETA